MQRMRLPGMWNNIMWFGDAKVLDGGQPRAGGGQAVHKPNSPGGTKRGASRRPPVRSVACPPGGGHDQRLGVLLNLRRELLTELEHCRADLPGSGDRPSDVADEAIDKVSKALAATTIEHLAHRIREVEAALERLEEGAYGICIDCGRRISQARIRANPTARRCLKCQSACEKSRGPGLPLYS